MLASLEQPPKKRRKITKTSDESFKTAIKSAFNSPSLADVVYCIPIPDNEAEHSDLNEKKQDADDSQEEQDFDVQTNDKNDGIEAKGSQDEEKHVEYKEYSLNSYPFIVHSTVFKTMLIDNNKNRNNNKDGLVKIALNDLDVETFEFIRNYCHGLQPKLEKKNIFKVLLASIKYMIDSMMEKCIEYIRNEWIVDRVPLFTFLKRLSAFENKTNSNIISKQSILKVFNNNKVLQRYACQFWDGEECTDIIKKINSDILILLLQCDSFYMNESIIWRMVVQHIEHCVDVHNARKSAKFGQLLSQFVPFIRFDIIGLEYFLSNIKELLFDHNLMTDSQLCDIFLSWHDKSRYKDKFTLKRQRFLFETNYLTCIDDIKIGDCIDYIAKNDATEGFYTNTVIDIEKTADTETVKLEDGTRREWCDVLVAKPWSIMYCTNDRFMRLQPRQVVQFRNVFECNDGDKWFNGTISPSYHDIGDGRGGEPAITCTESHVKWHICVNDPRCFRIRE